MKIRLKLLAIGLIIILFSGCTGVNLPSPKTYKLELSEKCCKINKEKKNITIKILEPVTNKSLNTSAIYYTKEKYQLQTYKLSKWSDYPVKMLLEVLSNNIDGSNMYDNVVTSHIYAKVDYTLQSELIKFNQNISNDRSNIVLKIKFYLTNSKNRKIISKTFYYLEDTQSTNAYGAVIAFNKAVEKLNKDIILWVYENTQ